MRKLQIPSSYFYQLFYKSIPKKQKHQLTTQKYLIKHNMLSIKTCVIKQVTAKHSGTSKLHMRLTHEACPSFGCEVLLKKESRVESQMPHRSCSHLQSFQTGGTAEEADYQKLSSPGCCHIFPLCHVELSEQIPWQINKKIL